MVDSRTSQLENSQQESYQTVYQSAHAPSTPGSGIDQFVDAPQPIAGSHPVERQSSRVPIETLDPSGTTELSRKLTQHTQAESQDLDLEKRPTANPFSEDGKFDLEKYMKELLQRGESRGIQGRQMGLAFKDLTVTGVGAGVTLSSSLGSVLLAPFRALKPSSLKSMFNPPIKTILHQVDGSVKPGEMCLVLGRPGAGCTSLLKALASYRDGFKDISGEVLYEGWDHKAIDGLLRGEITLSPEDDVHFPTLTVAQTLDFAAATRAPQEKRRVTLANENHSRPEYISMVRESIATILGLRHTYNTKVGNDLVRGVSGGERKRVSIAETMASRALIRMFDNSSRGLDSSTALEFVQALRIMTDVGKVATLCSIYQAGESLTQIFDKVLVLWEGHEVYCGPVTEAAAYFNELGFERIDRQTTADFLVACTDLTGRKVKKGCEKTVPQSAEEMGRIWKQSKLGQSNTNNVVEYLEEMKRNHTADEKKKYQSIALDERAQHTRKGSKFLMSWPQQIRIAIKRRAQVQWGDIMTQIIIIGASTFQGLIMGSVFFQMPKDTSGFFSRGGVIFFALLYNAFTAMSEINNSYGQRPIVIRHNRFAMLHPAADAAANTLLDMPFRLLMVTVFDILLYFMTGLVYDAGAFFIFWTMTLLLTFTMVAFFRALSATTKAEAVATMVAGLVIIDVALYAGYVIPRPSMVIWWKWLSYCNPISFAFEILMTNEFRFLNVPCAAGQLIPPGADLANQVCAVAGSAPGQDIISGSNYLNFSYGYLFSNSGRNAGIVLGFWIAFTLWYCIASEFQTDPGAKGAVMVFKRSSAPKTVLNATKATGDLENQNGKADIAAIANAEASPEEHREAEEAAGKIAVGDDVFVWRDVTFDVKIKGGTRRLLNHVSGYVQPGKLTALMGESGAGKTTLLNILAQRGDVGVVGGEFMVNGRDLPRSFQSSTGYCQQQDVHLPTTTVREALQFSGLLRQSTGTREEKLAYVENVIKMLEMEDWAEALVGQVGEGLNVEQRKRLTIGVELAAKPSLLLFLDEPTSGLDAQAAWSVVRFLRKLADAGQAILCTIHQPSGELFSQFDRLCLLKKGGETVYFGDIGDNSKTLINYFEAQGGRKCGDEENVAEYILDVIGAGATATTKQDWAKLFRESTANERLMEEVRQITSKSSGEQSAEEEARGHQEYAAPFSLQVKLVAQRTFQFYWRNPTYVGAKLALNLIAGLFIGSSFWNQGTLQTTASLQNKLFAIFMALVISTSLAQQLQPIFIQLRSIYDVRERPSKLYRWPVLTLACIMVELPWNILGGTLFWLPWNFMIQFRSGSEYTGYSWATICIVFEFYFQTFAQAVASISPNPLVASILFSTFFSFVIVFCGVVQPPPQLPTFWRSWMFNLTPFKYLVEGLLGNAIGGVPVRCSQSEFSTLTPPTGQTCEQFLGGFSSNLDGVGNTNGSGYFTTAANGDCNFCQYKMGDDFLSSVNMNASNKKRNIGILFSYIAFNIFLALAGFYIYSVRSHKQVTPKRSSSAVQGEAAAGGLDNENEKPLSKSDSSEAGAEIATGEPSKQPSTAPSSADSPVMTPRH